MQDLKVKALVWKRNCETSSRTKFIVWKRNCVTSKSQYFPCAEAELRHFRAPKSHTILYAEPELRNFKSQYIPCAEAELQAKEYSMCGSGNAELQGPIRRNEGDFLTLQEGPRKGLSPVLPRALAGAY